MPGKEDGLVRLATHEGKSSPLWKRTRLYWSSGITRNVTPDISMTAARIASL